jgi:hypothetical protein
MSRCGRCKFSLGAPTRDAPLRCGCAWGIPARVYVAPERTIVHPAEDASRRGGRASALRRAVRRMLDGLEWDPRSLAVRALEARGSLRA